MKRGTTLWSAAAATLAGGYFLLTRGEATVSVVLLFVGYLVLVPAAIRFGYNSEWHSRSMK